MAKERREELVSRTSGQLTVASVQVSGQDMKTDLALRLEEAAAESDAVFVHGLDALLLDLTGRSRQSPALAHLNQSRDLLPERVSARVVLWMSRRAYGAFRIEALDLSEVILTMAELDELRATPRQGVLPAARSYEAPHVDQLRNAEALERVARDTRDPRSSGDAALSASKAYLRAGRPMEALEMGEFAHRIFAASGHSAVEHQAELASSLENLGAVQSDLSRGEEALKSTAEAVEIYRRLAGVRPDAFLSNLAGSLNDLGVMQSELGHREAALAVTAESVETYRKLALARPDAFLPDLASSLNNLGNAQSELGHREGALAATAESVATYRKLAHARPTPSSRTSP